MRLLISTGEVSGDLQGSFLVKALIEEAARRSIEIEIFALGGYRMQAAGAKLISDTTSIGAIGFWEALPFIFPTLKAQSKVDKFLKQQPPDSVVLIDYMGPNIRLGNKIRKISKDIPITYYIAPQEWAWRLGEGGTTDLIGFTDQILAIFQAEAKFYSDRGGSVKWVGHPMLDTVSLLPERNDALKELGLNTDSKVLLILPASRKQELRYVMPTLVRAAALIQKKDPSVVVVIPAAQKSFEAKIKECLSKNNVIGKIIPAKDTDKLKPILFSAADIALGKSGTVNMELALNFVPQIVGYKVSRVTAFLARHILRFNVDHISPVNLLLEERLIPELVQKDFNSFNIAKVAIELLENNETRDIMQNGYTRLRQILGSKGVTERAANEILDLTIK